MLHWDCDEMSFVFDEVKTQEMKRQHEQLNETKSLFRQFLISVYILTFSSSASVPGVDKKVEEQEQKMLKHFWTKRIATNSSAVMSVDVLHPLKN